MSGRDLFLGIDLGGSKILAGVVAPEGRILSRAKRATPFADGPEALAGALSEAVDEAMASAGVGRARIAAVGMGSPGPLDPERGVILRTPNIAVEKFAVGPWLARSLGAPVVLDNDVHMALYGEFRAGAAQGRQSVVGLWVGTGVGGAILQDGAIVHGVNRNAGELGHMILDARRTRPGKPQGTLEWEASKTGIARHVLKGIRRGKKSSLAKFVGGKKKGNGKTGDKNADNSGDNSSLKGKAGKDKRAHASGGERLHSSDLAAAYAEKDRLAVAAVERSGRYVGIALANLFDALAPELFVLGGGVATALGGSYLAIVRAAANAYAFTTDLGGIRIALSRLGDDAGLLGAALAAQERSASAAKVGGRGPATARAGPRKRAGGTQPP